MHLEKHKKLKGSCARIIVSSLSFTIVLFSFSSCNTQNSFEKNDAETHLSEAMVNTFSFDWFDECTYLQDLAEMTTDKSKEKSPDYLVGYLESNKSARENYLKVIYTSQKGLQKKLITDDTKEKLDLYRTAKSDYLQKLKKQIETENQIPQEEAFQSNTKELAVLIPYININANELRKSEEAQAFRENLEKATQYLKDAFPDTSFEEEFPSASSLS